MNALSRSAPAVVRPLALPRVSRAEVDRANRIAAARSPVTTRFGALPLQVALLLQDAPVPVDWRLTLQAGDKALVFHCPHALLTLLLRAQEPALSFARALSPTLLALLIDTLIQPSLPHWQGLLGCSVRFLGIEADSAVPSGAVWMQVSAAGQAWPAALSGDAPLDRLLDAWPSVLHPAPALPIPVRLWIGTTVLPAGIVRTLRLGDAVLVETAAPGGLMLAAAGGWGALAWRQGAQIVLAEAPRRRPELEEETRMPHSDPSAEPGTIDDLPIQLRFDAGRLELPLAEVRRLQAGSVLPLGRTAAGLIEISANGRRIGTGELVELDGSIAVRITRLTGLG